MGIGAKIKIAESELSLGAKGKAFRRLENLTQYHPNNMELRNQVAEIYYESGFYDLAGKFWIFHDPKEPRISKCVSIYEKSMNNSGFRILNDLVFRGNKKDLPIYGQKKLEELEENSLAFYHSIPEFVSKLKTVENKSTKFEKQTWKEQLSQIILFSTIIYYSFSCRLDKYYYVAVLM
ncbi:MAG: hypothetical protein N4A45_10190 [Flavobacteriales bacterium]|jgi:hypothetical protein|nr:hypothetical protein [Flavobacteriales bacterium]